MKSLRYYSYVGPPAILKQSRDAEPGATVRTRADIEDWLAAHRSSTDVDGTVTATFVIDATGLLRLADQRSEHVACASGGPVLSAGEITFDLSDLSVTDVSNQSTGFCPEPESWPHVADALDRIAVTHPPCFTIPIVFRLCHRCGEQSIVKDDWYVCMLCDAELPRVWNFQ